VPNRVATGLGHEDVFVRVDVVLQEPVGNDHVNTGRFDELSDLDLLDGPKVPSELESQIGSRLARTALANRVSFYDHALSVEPRKHAQALIDELFSL
jgi:hypothetical protein